MGVGKQLYSVIIIRRDAQHIIALESEKFDEVYTTWKTLIEEWKTSATEQRPLILEKPIVTAFDPGLVSEIKIDMFEVHESNAHNPYSKEMKNRGLTETLNKYKVTGHDILDNGYKVD